MQYDIIKKLFVVLLNEAMLNISIKYILKELHIVIIRFISY